MAQPLDTDSDAQLNENKPNLHLGFYMRKIPDELTTSWKLLVDVMSKSFRKRSRLHRTPLWSCNTRAMRSTDETMTRNKVQILLMPDLGQTAGQSPGAVNADLEQTEAKSPGYMLQISSR